jgi:hypothetical protein
MKKSLLILLTTLCYLTLVGCGVKPAPSLDEEARKAFRGGPMPPAVAAKIKAHQNATKPVATTCPAATPASSSRP